MEWKKLTKKTMPPENVDILLWLDYGHQGYPLIGRYSDGVVTRMGYKDIDPGSYRSIRWAEIEPPAGEINFVYDGGC